MPEKKSLREILRERGLATAEQLDRLEGEAGKTGLPFRQVVLKTGLVSEEELGRMQAEELGVPFLDLTDYLIDPEVIKLVPETAARKYRLIPLFRIGDSLTVAMEDPQDVVALDEVRRLSRMETVEPVLAAGKSIAAAVDQHYETAGKVEKVIQGIAGEKKEKIPALPAEAGMEPGAREAPVIKLVNLLIIQAVKDGASDVHIEPEENAVRIRYRVDGILHQANSLTKSLESAVVSRIKVLAKLDISEKRKPQDGRFQLRMENRQIDLRVSTFPTVNGENVVMRILDKTNVLPELEQLGFAPEILKTYLKLIRLPYGIILDTGPTGSGKTTTLYATLAVINSVEKNIITLEDPIEYQLPLIRQSQVNPKAGLTFATGLRSILRQDPNVVMVGEIRDRETAEIAIQAAMTGHLVFSTLHTNDTAGALTRLEDMGMETFLIASSVSAILAQRLVRTLCPRCREEYSPVEEQLIPLGLTGKTGLRFFRPKGCKSCRDTGYRGRIGIFELLVVDEEIKRLVMSKAPANLIRDQAVAAGMKTLREDGRDKVIAGLTSVEEVLRAA